MNAEVRKFGDLPEFKEVREFTLKNGQGLEAKILNYGGIIRELWTPAADGSRADIVLGFDNLADYAERSPYFGSLVGRVANRIARGEFSVDGKAYKVAVNNGPNHLHGGLRGFDKVIWDVREYKQESDSAELVLAYTSRDGEEGYPGELRVTVTYRVTPQNELTITYDADTNKATPVNLTSHSYFNLAGKGDVLAHVLTLSADAYTPSDATLIPTGEIQPVAGTPFDFRAPKRIGEEIGAVPGGGYDHNFVVRGGGRAMTPVAHVEDPGTGRVMDIFSTEPGVQFYTGNFLDGSLRGKSGTRYVKHSGFCLETQHFPDAMHHAKFPSIILRPEERFHSETVHRFSVKR